MDFTLLLALFIGFIIGVLFMAFFYIRSNKKLKEYQRKLEKTSVQSTEDSSKVAVLEEKIKVLEKALQSALENKEG